MDASIRAYGVGARAFRQAQYQWPALMLRAMRALMEGHFTESDALTKDVSGLAERHRDMNAMICVMHHRAARFYASENHAALMEVESQIQSRLGNFGKRTPVSLAIAVWCQAHAGLTEQVGTSLAALRDSPVLLRYRVLMPMVAEACLLLRETELAQKIYDRLLPEVPHFYTRGPNAMYVSPPYSQPLGLLAMTLGRWPEAVQHLEDALARSETMGLRVHLARLQYQCARALMGRSSAGDAEQALVRLARAKQLATMLGQTGLLPLIDELTHESRQRANQEPLLPQAARVD